MNSDCSAATAAARSPSPSIRSATRKSLGYDSFWTSEAYGSDAVSPAAWILAQTEKLKVGTAIMQMPARSPAMTAMTAMTLAELSGRRFMLGLGASGPQVVEGWHGVPYGSRSRGCGSTSGSSSRSSPVRPRRRSRAINTSCPTAAHGWPAWATVDGVSQASPVRPAASDPGPRTDPRRERRRIAARPAGLRSGGSGMRSPGRPPR